MKRVHLQEFSPVDTNKFPNEISPTHSQQAWSQLVWPADGVTSSPQDCRRTQFSCCAWELPSPPSQYTHTHMHTQYTGTYTHKHCHAIQLQRAENSLKHKDCPSFIPVSPGKCLVPNMFSLNVCWTEEGHRGNSSSSFLEHQWETCLVWISCWSNPAYKVLNGRF